MKSRRQKIRPSVKIEGKRYVLIEEAEFRRMQKGAASEQSENRLPPLPGPDKDGNVPALEFARMIIARDIIRERNRLGLTQEKLASLAGVRQETICRLELGLQSPTVRTVQRIDDALKRAASRKQGVIRRKK